MNLKLGVIVLITAMVIFSSVYILLDYSAETEPIELDIPIEVWFGIGVLLVIIGVVMSMGTNVLIGLILMLIGLGILSGALGYHFVYG